MFGIGIMWDLCNDWPLRAKKCNFRWWATCRQKMITGSPLVTIVLLPNIKIKEYLSRQDLVLSGDMAGRSFFESDRFLQIYTFITKILKPFSKAVSSFRHLALTTEALNLVFLWEKSQSFTSHSRVDSYWKSSKQRIVETLHPSDWWKNWWNGDLGPHIFLGEKS